MADTFTAHYGWTKPQVGGDPDTWGGLLNTDLDNIDSTVFSISGVANAAMPKAGGTFTGAVTIDTSAINAAALTLKNTGSQGAQLVLQGNGATTPNKYIRAFSGTFQVVNSGNSAAILTIDDSGNVSSAGSFTAGTTLAATSNGTIGGTLAVNGGVITTSLSGITTFWQLNPFGITSTFGVGTASNIPFIIGMNNAESARVSPAGIFTLSGASNGNGAQIVLNGNGGTTPNKTIRSRSGSFEFVNSANTAIISSLTDGGTWTATDFVATSDGRLKVIREDFTGGYEELKRVRVVEYDKYTDATKKHFSQREIGVIAQELAEILPTAVQQHESTGLLGVSVQQLLMLVINAVQDMGRALEREGIL